MADKYTTPQQLPNQPQYQVQAQPPVNMPPMAAPDTWVEAGKDSGSWITRLLKKVRRK